MRISQFHGKNKWRPSGGAWLIWMKIRKRWRDKIDVRCLGRIGFWLLLGWLIFGIGIGFHRIEGETQNDLRDGDLVIYEKIWRRYSYDDTVLFEKDGEGVAKVADMNGGVVKGRVLALLRVRGIGSE